MKSLEALRTPELIVQAAARVKAFELTRPIRIMEVCGGHTAAIYRFGIHHLLPETIELLSGPGCPVCVTPVNFIDHAIALAKQQDVVLATFGDLLRVPGSNGSLSDARGTGVETHVFYSPAHALEFAEQNPKRTIVFLGVGFETTACTIAATMCSAIDKGTTNFKLLSAMKTMPAALRALLSSPETKIDGLLLPGHVSTITGTEPFEFIAAEFNIACAVSGFEPIDLLDCIGALAEQNGARRAEVQNRYRRAVKTAGNTRAQEAISRVCEPCYAEWRGLGGIAGSGLKLRDEFAEWDAANIEIDLLPSREHPACRCGEVLRGAIHPRTCALFGRGCTPEHAIGACMVSSEGACAAVYNYQTDNAD